MFRADSATVVDWGRARDGWGTVLASLLLALLALVGALAAGACGDVLALSPGGASPLQAAEPKAAPASLPTCHRETVVDPPEMEGGPGLWFQSEPDGAAPVPPEGCPDTYPRWSITPAGTRFKVYHRPHDATSGNADPERYGNWANITNPTPGTTYTIRTEYGIYSTEISFTARGAR